MHPIRPDHNQSCVDGRGRTGRRIGVGGMGEKCGNNEVLGNEVDEVAEEHVEIEEETQPVSALPSPYMPTQSERDDHDLTHATYRSWCEHCVQGRGVEMGHRVGDDHSERGVAVIGFDYMFLTQKDVYSRAEWDSCPEKDIDERFVMKVLVVRNMLSKSLFAHAVAAKGSDDAGFAVQCIVDDITWLGYSRVILKSDNEPAIVRLLKDALNVLRVEGGNGAGL